jgi:hypothetical protein
MRQLSRQLKDLSQSVKPDEVWRERSREILLMQVRQGAVEKDAQWFTFIESQPIQRLLVQLTRPLSVVAVSFLIFLGAGIWSLQASSQSKPGDALYIAKIISEKTQFALTFDNMAKAKLNLAFAANRAEELAQLHDEQPIETKEADNLKAKLNSQLNEAQARIAKMPAQSVKRQESAKTVAAIPAKDNAKAEPAKAANEVEVSVSVNTASLEKSQEVVEYYDPRQLALEAAKASLEKNDYNATAQQLKALGASISEPEEIAEQGTSSQSSDIVSEKLEKSSSTPVE